LKFNVSVKSASRLLPELRTWSPLRTSVPQPPDRLTWRTTFKNAPPSLIISDDYYLLSLSTID